MPRTFHAGTQQVALVRLELKDQYASLIEVGSPASLRSFRLRQLETELRNKPRGFLIHDLEALREAAAARSDQWLASELVTARLTAAWIPPGQGSRGGSS